MAGLISRIQFSSMPTEILSLVTSHIDERDVANVSRVNKKLCEVVRENASLWRNIATPYQELRSDVSVKLRQLSDEGNRCSVERVKEGIQVLTLVLFEFLRLVYS